MGFIGLLHTYIQSGTLMATNCFVNKVYGVTSQCSGDGLSVAVMRDKCGA
jgi:hypothetical protein